jgi:hypothetical protein
MRTIRWCLGLLLLLAALSPIAHAQDTATWEPGMYWTYDATLTWGRTQTSPMTLVIAAADPYFHFGAWAWVMVGIYDQSSDIQLVTVKSILGAPQAYVRWPTVVDFLMAFEPVSPMPSIASSAASMPMSLENQPIRIETVSRAPSPRADECARVDWLDTTLSLWEVPETVTLIPRETTELVLPSGTFPDSIPIEYERARGDRHSGVAWWVPELLCWGAAEGIETILYAEPVYEYKITLAEWGRWSEAEMTDRIRAALDSMKPLGADEANEMRTYLRSFGLDL